MELLVLKMKDESDNESTGNIDIRNFGYFFMNNVSNYMEIISTMSSKGLNLNQYKFCVLDDGKNVPFFMNIKNKMSMQIMEFEFKTVTVEEYGMDEEQLKAMITPSLLEKKQNIYNSNITEIFKIVSEMTEDKNFKESYKELVEIDKELNNFDKTKYLKMQL